ncbi:hypothetical protein AB6813_09030 [bacterium RCC_150]
MELLTRTTRSVTLTHAAQVLLKRLRSRCRGCRTPW